MRKAVLVAASTLALAGCGINEWLEGKSEYKSASTLPPLEIPPDLTTPARDNRYLVPESKTATLSGYEAERRDASKQAPGGGPMVLPQAQNMRVERAGTQRWLVVDDMPPERLWPLVRDFWQESGFLIKLEVPQAGVMETDWAESRAKIQEGGFRWLLSKALDQVYSSSERDKYRTRLDRTADGKGTEIYISHRGMVEVYTTMRDPQSNAPGDTKWQPREPDPELEVEFLRRLMVRLGAQDEKAKATVAAAAPAQQRSEITKGVDGSEFLQVSEPFDRTWRRVGLALDRVGFTVEDRDRAKGIYFVRYADPEAEMKERGLLERWFSSPPKVTAQQYRVQVSTAGTVSQVNVLNRDGANDGSRTAQRILALLHEQLK
jgi:outer membrane protein assembly factor BamC